MVPWGNCNVSKMQRRAILCAASCCVRSSTFWGNGRCFSATFHTRPIPAPACLDLSQRRNNLWPLHIELRFFLIRYGEGFGTDFAAVSNV